MSEHLVRDPSSGTFRNAFTIDLEGTGSDRVLTFRFDERRRDVPAIDGGELARELADLVSCANLESPVAPGPARLGAMPLINRGRDQYRLNNAHGLLSVAEAVGPLFGSHDARAGMVDGNIVREPLDCWTTAAGALAFAGKLMSVLDDGQDPVVLDNEVVFGTVVYSNVRFLRADYLVDSGFPGAYGQMLAVDEQEYESTFPTEASNGAGTETVSQGGYDNSGTVWFRRSSARTPFAADAKSRVNGWPDPGAYRSASESEEGAITLYDEYGRKVGSLGSTGHVYAWLARGEASPFASPGAPSPFRDFSLPDGEVFSVTFTNAALTERTEREAMYSRLFDALAMLHTHRVVTDRRWGRERMPRYSNALEHLWCSLVDSKLKWPTRYCPYCGRPFLASRGRTWCSDLCSQEGRVALKRRRQVTIRAAAKDVAMGHDDMTFSVSEVVDLIGIPDYKDEILKTVREMSRGRNAELAPKGGNGIGQRFQLIERDLTRKPQ